MKKIKNLIPFLAVAFTTIMISCGSGSKEKEAYDAVMKEVIAVHDEVMPKMGKINALIQQMEDKVDTTEVGLQFAEAKADLEASSQSMMMWMKDFSENFSVGEEIKDSIAEKLELLKKEEDKVNKVKEQINSSIQKAEDLLGSN